MLKEETNADICVYYERRLCLMVTPLSSSLSLCEKNKNPAVWSIHFLVVPISIIDYDP